MRTFLTIVLIASGLVFSFTTIAQPEWECPTAVLSYDSPDCIAIGDIDGNGIDNFIVASTGDGPLSWWEYSTGEWQAHVIVASLPQVIDLEAGDLNGDGFVDLVACSKRSDAIHVFINDGAGGTDWDQILLRRAEGIYEADPFDMDNDGDLDLLICSATENYVAWLENGADLWEYHLIAANIPDCRKAEAGDYDGDGDLDVFVCAYDEYNALYWNHGTYWEYKSAGSSRDRVDRMYMKDMRGDGTAELLIHNRGSGDVYRFTYDSWNDGHGIVTISNQYVQPGDFDVVDIDRDLDLDIVGFGYDGRLRWSEGVRMDWTDTPIGELHANQSAIKAIDYDGDGDNDLVITSEYVNTITLITQLGEPSPVVMTLSRRGWSHSNVQFHIAVANHLPIPVENVDYWEMITTPDGSVVGPIFQSQVTLPAYYHTTYESVTRYFPPDMQNGIYTYTAYMGYYPDSELEDSFQFDYHYSSAASIEPNPAVVVTPAHPNPFNAVTTLKLIIQTDTDLTVHVYNSLGQLVRTLADGPVPAGDLNLSFDAGELASGLYFLSVSGPGLDAQVQKLMLLR